MWPPRNLGKQNTISGLVLCQIFVQHDWISNPHQIEPQVIRIIIANFKETDCYRS